MAGASASLPYLDTIQQSFGNHDVSGIRAQVGGAAAQAAREIGAQAYATGDRVAFASAPDLHTAAHEAAHVVQQRAGVHLKGGVGEAGDPYEQHADQVADLVVQGRSAQGALDDGISHGGGNNSWAVQRKLKFGPGTEYLKKGLPRITGYDAVIKEAEALKPEIAVSTVPKGETPRYSPDPTERKGTIFVNEVPTAEQTYRPSRDYYNSFLTMAHETRHAIDDVSKKVNYRKPRSDDKIRTEWRSYATHTAVASQMVADGTGVDSRYQNFGDFESSEAFMKSPQMLDLTGAYLRAYKIDPSADDTASEQFMTLHKAWVDEAVALFKSLGGKPYKHLYNPNTATGADLIVDAVSETPIGVHVDQAAQAIETVVDEQAAQAQVDQAAQAAGSALAEADNEHHLLG